MGAIELSREAASHVRDVLRLKSGDVLCLSDGAGAAALGEILEAGRRHVRIRIESVDRTPPPGPPHVALLQCVGKGAKMDAVVRQATELGARAIVPVLSDRSMPRREARIERWRAIAEDAIRVSGRAFRPTIDPVTDIDRVFLKDRAPLALCLSGGAKASLAARLSSSAPFDRVEILIGPEGGLSDDETERAERAGFSLAHLGPHTLRTETAGPAAVAIVLFSLGGLGR